MRLWLFISFPLFLIFSVFSEEEPDLNNELEISVSSNFYMVIRKAYQKLSVILSYLTFFPNTNLYINRNND